MIDLTSKLDSPTAIGQNTGFTLRDLLLHLLLLLGLATLGPEVIVILLRLLIGL